MVTLVDLVLNDGGAGAGDEEEAAAGDEAAAGVGDAAAAAAGDEGVGDEEAARKLRAPREERQHRPSQPQLGQGQRSYEAH